jgi:hypothetical protein
MHKHLGIDIILLIVECLLKTHLTASLQRLGKHRQHIIQFVEQGSPVWGRSSSKLLINCMTQQQLYTTNLISKPRQTVE